MQLDFSDPPHEWFPPKNPSDWITETRNGRVNLIGEHTDYNFGFVLPMLIPQATRVMVSPRADLIVRCGSAQFRNQGIAEYSLGSEQRSERRAWFDHIQGVTKIFQEEHPDKLRGFDVWVDSSVPVGSGLSSSAALQVALFNALFKMCGISSESFAAIPRLAQRVERKFLGANVGLMDQMVIHHARAGEAMFLDIQSMKFESIPIPDTVDWVVIDSGVPHEHAGGDYNTRVKECLHACQELGVENLRACGLDDLPRIQRLAEPLRRRAKHVVTENARVLAAVEAIKNRAWKTLGQLMVESHESQRDDYRVSIAAIDTLVEIALRLPRVLGARLTGGGFGGSIIVLAEQGVGKEVGRKIVEEFSQSVGPTAKVLTPR
jgi:galactokinase